MGISLFLLSTFQKGTGKTFSLTVKVNNLRNTKGNVLFALYNKKGAIPDEKFRNYFRITSREIIRNSSEVTFRNLVPGRYAVSILHDEDSNGKIKHELIFGSDNATSYYAQSLVRLAFVEDRRRTSR